MDSAYLHHLKCEIKASVLPAEGTLCTTASLYRDGEALVPILGDRSSFMSQAELILFPISILVRIAQMAMNISSAAF